MKIEETHNGTLDVKDIHEAIKMYMRHKGYEVKDVRLTATVIAPGDDDGYAQPTCTGATITVLKLKECA